MKRAGAVVFGIGIRDRGEHVNQIGDLDWQAGNWEASNLNHIFFFTWSCQVENIRFLLSWLLTLDFCYQFEMSVVPFGCKTLKSFSCLRPLFFCLHLRILAMFFWDRAPTSQVLRSSSLKIPVLADGGFQFCSGFFMSILEPLRISRWCPAGVGSSMWGPWRKHNILWEAVSRPQKLTSLRNIAKQNAEIQRQWWWFIP